MMMCIILIFASKYMDNPRQNTFDCIGCGTWPAFWLTDEANWPVNGEIDIVEGVNYQDTAKTALHTTKECRMDDVPEGSKTGT